MVKIFHHDDLDGYSSGYLVGKYFKDLGKPIEYYVMNYNSEFPIDNITKEDEVYIVDYSIDPEIFKLCQEKSLETVWIDHHTSSIQKYEEVFDNLNEQVLGSWEVGNSATYLVYLYFYSDDLPEWVKSVDAWDTWKEDSEYYNSGELLNLSLQNILSIDIIEQLDTDNKFYNECLEIGSYFKEYRDEWSNSFAEKYGFETEIEDYSGEISTIFVLSLGNANSKFFGNRINKYDYCVTQGFDGEKWNISVYSNKPDKDCSKFAQVFGGGGHKGASGFTYYNTIPLFIKNKKEEVI